MSDKLAKLWTWRGPAIESKSNWKLMMGRGPHTEFPVIFLILSLNLLAQILAQQQIYIKHCICHHISSLQHNTNKGFSFYQATILLFFFWHWLCIWLIDLAGQFGLSCILFYILLLSPCPAFNLLVRADTSHRTNLRPQSEHLSGLHDLSGFSPIESREGQARYVKYLECLSARSSAWLTLLPTYLISYKLAFFYTPLSFPI